MMNGEFTLAFTIPISKSRIRLEVVGLAERGNYKIPVHNVRIDGNDSAVEVEKTASHLVLQKGADNRCAFLNGLPRTDDDGGELL